MRGKNFGSMWSSRIHLGSGGGQASDEQPPITLSCEVESGPTLLTKFNPVWRKEGSKGEESSKGGTLHGIVWHGMAWSGVRVSET